MRRASEAETAPGPVKAARTDALSSPSSLPNAAPPFPLTQLHRDLLGVVLSHLPQRYRLRIASRVCKHWRCLTLATVRTLKLELTPDVGLALYPALASLVCLPCCSLPLSETDVAVSFPTALTSLRLHPTARWRAEGISPRQLTHLTVGGLPSQWQTLVLPSCETLQSLELLGLLPYVPFDRFPRLTRLAVLDCSNPFPAFAITTIGTQLRALSLGSPQHLVPERFLGEITCPALTALACHARSLQHVAASLLRLRQQSPSLTDLMVACNYAGVPVPALPALAALSRLDFSQKNSPSFYTDTLPKLTRLKVLALNVDPEMLGTYTRWPPPVLAAVRSVAVGYHTGPELWAFLAKCTNITKIDISRALIDAAETRVSLPSLRKLHVSDDSWEEMLSVVSKFRPFAPSLSKVSMLSLCVPAPDMVPLVCIAGHGMGLSALRLTAIPPPPFTQPFPPESVQFAANFSRLDVVLTTRPKTRVFTV